MAMVMVAMKTGMVAVMTAAATAVMVAVTRAVEVVIVVAWWQPRVVPVVVRSHCDR
jgi:hypothetical protein